MKTGFLDRAIGTTIGKVALVLAVLPAIGLLNGGSITAKSLAGCLLFEIFPAILFVIGGLTYKGKSKDGQLSNAPQSKAELLETYYISNPGLRLRDGERCYYKGAAESYYEKNVVVGRRSSGSGASIRVAKGVSYHSGGSASENVRGQVGERYKGTFFLTNQRVVLSAMKFGFDLDLADIDSVNYDPKNGFMFFSDGKAYTVLSKETGKIERIFNLIEIPEKPQEQPKQPVSPKSYTDELKELKALLDDGAITQEEYDAKKAQLLGL